VTRPPVVYGDLALHVVAEWPEAAFGLGPVELMAGASAGTVAGQLAALGHPPVLVGVTGADAAGALVRAELEALGVDCRLVEAIPGPTTRVLALVAPGDRRAMAVAPGADWPSAGWAAREPPWPGAPDDLAYIPGFPGFESTVRSLVGRGARVVADAGFLPLLSDRTRLRAHATGLAPGLEVLVLSGGGVAEPENRALADVCLAAGARAVVTTLGPDGLLATTAQGTVHQPAHLVEARNSLCAGDSVVAGLIAGLAEGLPLEPALALGQAVAAARIAELATFARRPSPLAGEEAEGRRGGRSGQC